MGALSLAHRRPSPNPYPLIITFSFFKKMESTLPQQSSSSVGYKGVDYYWNPHSPKFYEHLVYGAGKPRCVVPLEAFRQAAKQDESFARNIRQQFTDIARNGNNEDGLTNLAFFLLIIDNDLETGGDLLKDASKSYPTAQSLCQYARFLYNVKKEYTTAWQLFEKALVLDPTHVDTIGYYAGFVASVQRDYDHAEQLFLHCLEIAPSHPNHLGGFARFLATVRGRYDDAETYFERSIKADPYNVVNLNNYAAFLAEIRKNFELAEQYFRTAVDIDPTCGFAVRNLLNFLVWMRGDEAAAKELWQRGGAEALRSSMDETYHPDEIYPAVREDMAAEARFMEAGKRKLAEQTCKAAAMQGQHYCNCVSCGQAGACYSITRAPNSTCEGPTCSCVGVRWCAACVLQHYWHDTKSELKSFARCPTCRAEFCLTDIQVCSPAQAHLEPQPVCMDLEEQTCRAAA